MDLKNQIQKREIKFRALCDYDDTAKTMVYFESAECDNGIFCMPTPNNISHIDEYLSPLMQFTGLKDKAGKGNDVYEGDTFEAIYKDCPDGYSILGKDTTVIRIKATVVFKWGGFMVEMMHPVEKKLVYSRLADFLENEEKIVNGNIYENKV